MAFFTSQQLFGNGGGSPGGAGWVPIDTAAPPTFSANNRGIAFGEALTSAIANRPHYALALNDDDLNTRLAEFETGGLDAAYRLGLAGSAGDGRVVTIDGGAIEGRTALAATYASDVANAIFRASSLDDTVDGGGGFDFTGKGLSTSSAAQLFGFMDRRLLGFSAVSGTTITEGDNTVTLNPGSAGATIVQLAAGTFHTAGVTALTLGYDLIEITAGSFAGLYIIETLGGTNTRVTVKRLDGTSPTFTADTAATIRVYRPIFGSFSQYGANDFGSIEANLAVHGLPGATSGMDIVVGYDAVPGPTDAFRVRQHLADGSVATVMHIDAYGRVIGDTNSSDLTAADRARGAAFGASVGFAKKFNGSGNYESGFAVIGDNAGNNFYGLASQEYLTNVTDSVTGDLAFTFISASTIEFASSNPTQEYPIAGMTLVEIITPSQYAGVYLATTKNESDGTLTLATLGAGAPGFPGAGVGTARILYGTQIGGREVTTTATAANRRLSLTAAFRTAALITAPGDDAGTAALTLGTPTGGTGARALIRGFRADTGAGGSTMDTEVFAIDSNGNFETLGEVKTVDGDIEVGGATGEFKYTTPRTGKAFIVSVTEGRVEGGATPTWELEGVGTGATSDRPRWKSLVNGSGATAGFMAFPLNAYLREGMVITNVEVRVTMGAANATESNRMYVGLHRVAVDFSSPYTAATPSVVGSEYCANSLADQKISLSAYFGAGHTVDRDSYDYYLVVRSSSNGAATPDVMYGAKVTFTDPGPRNH